MSKNPQWDKRIEDKLWKSKDGTIHKVLEMTTDHILKVKNMMNLKLKIAQDSKILEAETLKLLREGRIPPEFEAMYDEALENLKLDEAINRISRQIEVLDNELAKRQWQ